MWNSHAPYIYIYMNEKKNEDMQNIDAYLIGQQWSLVPTPVFLGSYKVHLHLTGVVGELLMLFTTSVSIY